MMPYLLHWLMESVALLLTAYFVPGFYVQRFRAALIAAVVVGFVNMFIWPVLMVLTLPLTLVTFGLYFFVVNGLALKIAAALTPGFEIVGLWPAVFGSVVLTILDLSLINS